MPLIDARHYKALLISPDKSVKTEIAPLLAYGLPLAPVHDLSAYPNRRQLMDLFRTADSKVCFLDFTTPPPAFEVLADLHSIAPDIPVVALLSKNTPDLVLQCLRQGATDFLIRPFTTEQVDGCIEKIARVLPQPARSGSRGKVIAVMPAKGASGATTIACNLAHQCKRKGAPKVLLADMDPLTGTVSFVLKLKSTYSFIDVLQRESSLEADLWKQMTSAYQGIDVLLAPETLVDPQTELLTAAPIVEFAQTIYDAIILDCGGVYGAWNLSLARLAHKVLLVATNEVASLHSAQRALIYLENQRVDPGKVKPVVNRYQKEFGLQSDYFREALGAEVLQMVPADNDTVQRSLMEGKPLQSNSQIAKSLASMADKLIELRDQDSKKANGKGGLLSSLFR